MVDPQWNDTAEMSALEDWKRVDIVASSKEAIDLPEKSDRYPRSPKLLPSHKCVYISSGYLRHDDRNQTF